ncbi:MAG: glycosyltransferase, partial [Bacteroidota bacterium]|nr:glycosyltransferase [Bacteroidota bacterium]
MRIVIYESSSNGGCFEYAKELFKAYSLHPEVDHCVLLVPSPSNLNKKNIYKILFDDVLNTRNVILRKFYFLLRVVINPFILFFFLIKKKEETFVILNDFEQISAFVWVPFYRWFLGKHRFAVALHDPDRDDYPPSKSFSEYSMKMLLSIMDFGLYHESLPHKSYYNLDAKTIYLNVPHGIYSTA